MTDSQTTFDPNTVTGTDQAPWASKEFKYSKTFEGVGGKCTDYDNTATITETKDSASQKVTVCVGLDLTVAKTAAGKYDREYLWDITKDVDKTKVNISDDKSATFNYTVTASQTGITDTVGTLTGEITVTNPNDWEDITLTGLTDLAGARLDLHGRRQGQHR